MHEQVKRISTRPKAEEGFILRVTTIFMTWWSLVSATVMVRVRIRVRVRLGLGSGVPKNNGLFIGTGLNE